MAAPSSPTTTPIQWSIKPVSLGGLIIPGARLEIEVFLRAALPGLHMVRPARFLYPHSKHMDDWKALTSSSRRGRLGM